jgi:glycosyltransferase involved in cell wall biosynthesis
MHVSVIITTYNHPAWLEKVLRGYQVQTFRDFELVVADDGSDERTRSCIDGMRRDLPVPVHHIWHEDRGFRKCEILNRAILAASGRYLVFTDGDCIPRADFLAVHARLARPRRFLSGGYVKLPLDTSRRIDAHRIATGDATDARWLLRAGAPPGRRLLRLALPAFAGAAFDRLTPTRPSFNGHNASAWRADVIAANGFDERMGWGGLDRELGERLENAGIRGLQVRHRAIVVHLDHPRGYKDPAVIRRNREIRRETARTRRTRTEAGLDRHLNHA